LFEPIKQDKDGTQSKNLLVKHNIENGAAKQ